MNAVGQFPPVAGPASPAPADLAITIRDLRFTRDGRKRWWMNDDPVASAFLNSLSGTFPLGEAFFVESVKAFRDGVPPGLAEDIRSFVAQEVNHSREHVAFNRAAIDAGYDMSHIDACVQRWLTKARTRPAIVNLAATAALEHFTAIMAHEFLSRAEYFEATDAESAALWRWHAAEEIEHKAVAFDTYLHATRHWSRWKRWRVRSLVMALVTCTFLFNRVRDTLILLRQDGLKGPRVIWRLFAFLLWEPGVLSGTMPAWLRYFKPGFHPWDEDDRGLIADAPMG